MDRRKFLQYVTGSALAVAVNPSEIIEAAESFYHNVNLNRQQDQTEVLPPEPSYIPKPERMQISDDTFILFDANDHLRPNLEIVPNYRVLIIGDSNASVDWNGAENWPQYLFNDLIGACPGLQIINTAQGARAAGGDRTFLDGAKQNYLASLGRVNQTIVNIGTNNALHYTQAPDQFYYYWLDMVSAVNNLAPADALLATSLPPMVYHSELKDPTWVTPEKEHLIKSYNQRISRIVLRDPLFRNNMNAQYTKKNYLNLGFTKRDIDQLGVHLTDAAEHRVARNLRRTVQNGYRLAASHALNENGLFEA